ncbi:Lacal_2735 family protein [Persicobacter diffluens]|uniref:Lacal_2735 family protein n=1 Tax=Persicobacter diffluens TaxID=981 RepID=A0AAN4W0L4_9BACT|nr:hypothetical protein PEDI_32560 [Persicobacter diffluens]
MFGLFKKKSRIEVLHKSYQRLMDESFKLSTTNRRSSDQKYAEAQEVMSQIEQLSKEKA